ncbi:hypothetical protein KJ359_004209 [Pestalotiopsis sp. 9143b]|nr:hypothetical protein KJ359_004209 [Pestalotiopsis sp. 9143b]
MAAHSQFAKEFLQKVIGGDCAEMHDSLDSLSQVVAALRQQTVASEMSYPHARPVQRPSLPRCKMPPFEKTIPLIRMAESQTLSSSRLMYGSIELMSSLILYTN